MCGLIRLQWLGNGKANERQLKAVKGKWQASPRHLMQDGVMILIVSVLVEVQLDDVPQLQRLPTDRMLLELLDVWDNVCDVVHSAVGCASLQSEPDSSKNSLVIQYRHCILAATLMAGRAMEQSGVWLGRLTGSSNGVNVMAQQWKGRRLNGR